MNSREDLARLVDPLRRATAQRIKGTAATAVNAGEPEDVDRHAVVAPEVEPTLLGGDAASAALAVNTGCREIADPGEAGDCHNVAAVGCEHRVASCAGRHRH